jgi:hypothetical protein
MQLSDLQMRTPASSSGVFATLPREIMEMIFSISTIPDLLMLGTSSSVYHADVRDHIHTRSRRLVRPFIDDPERLFMMMDWTDSVISGSSALYFMIPSWDVDWVPRDLDIYVPNYARYEFVGYLESEGFEVVRRCSSVAELDPNGHILGTYEELGGFDEVIIMKQGSLSIDLIISVNTCAVECIIRFHQTVVMNFISSRGFFSAYPTLTDRARSLANNIAFYPLARPTKRITRCYLKYANRGASVRSSPLDWEADDETILLEYGQNKLPVPVRGLLRPHTCQQSFVCPNTIRTTFDAGCLFVSFDRAGNRIPFPVCDSAQGNPIPKARPIQAVAWSIGQESCDGSNDFMPPFVLSRGSFPILFKTIAKHAYDHVCLL